MTTLPETQMIAAITKTIPDARPISRSEWEGSGDYEGIVFLGSEDYNTADGLPIFNYYEDFEAVHRYNNPAAPWRGYYAEPGTRGLTILKDKKGRVLNFATQLAATTQAARKLVEVLTGKECAGLNRAHHDKPTGN